jgi:hypothetical protein
MQYEFMEQNPPRDMPYRILDGYSSDGRFSFSWSAFDLWHDWCQLQKPYPWQVGDRQFYFCVPQDERVRASYDRGKVALCTSADYLELCPIAGTTIPCVCAPFPDEHSDPALCSPAYCSCDERGCDSNNSLFYAFEDLTVRGDEMVGTWKSPLGYGAQAIAFDRGEP